MIAAFRHLGARLRLTGEAIVDRPQGIVGRLGHQHHQHRAWVISEAADTVHAWDCAGYARLQLARMGGKNGAVVVAKRLDRSQIAIAAPIRIGVP
ncbi:hypothetical protein DF055_19835 [Burkholderia cepacia]|nr:hypothetical protein DF055_19835 [Burkholderia cepacia]